MAKSDMQQVKISMQADTKLTEREYEILLLLAKGASNKDIALRLFISVNTVKVHMRNIFSKIGVTSRTEAAMYAVREQLTKAIPSELAPQLNLKQELFNASSGLSKINSTLHLSWSIVLALIVLIGMFTLITMQFRPNENVVNNPANISAPKRWQEHAKLPTARSGLAVAVYENKIYAIGGETAQGVTGVMERYDVEIDKWSVLKSKPLLVTDIHAAVIGGKIYIPGGRLASGDVTNVFESYDPGHDQWEKHEPLPVSLSGYALVAFEGKLYVFGGWDGQNFLASVYEYDPDKDKWIERTPMPTARGFAGASVAGGKIYVVGGDNGEGALTVNEEYLPERDVWSQRAPLPNGRYAFGLTSVADILYVFGGKSNIETSLPPWQYIYQKDQWQEFEGTYSEDWSHFGMVSTGMEFYTIGGQQNGLAVEKNLSYQAIYTILMPVIIK